MRGKQTTVRPHRRFVLIVVVQVAFVLLPNPARISYVWGMERDPSGTVLYNGIELPDTWPPKDIPATRDPMPVPYLEHPPAVVPIDIGRQLFVDDFLIEESSLERSYHHAEYTPENPVLKPDRPWEIEDSTSRELPAPTAMVFSDGVWYDPADALFKMWYMGGYVKGTCYATSEDGIRWEKPEFDVVPGTNIVHTANRDSGTVWLDLKEEDPAKRYKMFLYQHPEGAGAVTFYFSSDGIHWGNEVGRSGPTGDRSTVFYNPFRNVWVFSVRGNAEGLGRIRRYSEGSDVLAASQWKSGELPFWVGADRLDPERPDMKIQTQLYNLDCVAYESLMLGLFDIWHGQNDERPKPNDLCLGFSRDGFHWYRPDREPFIPVSENYGDWNWGNVQSAGGGCPIVGDRLYFYVSGRKGVKGSGASGVCSTGLAVLRRDGFASMDAGANQGHLTTRPLRFSGKHLFVNVDNPEGDLWVEILDEDGKPVGPFTRANCQSVQADSTLAQVHWKNVPDLSSLAGKPVRFRFHLRKGRLYSFWVSPEESGASHGYVAAGGPGFTGPTDTVGRGPLLGR